MTRTARARTDPLVRSWLLYDAANSVFVTTVTTALGGLNGAGRAGGVLPQYLSASQRWVARHVAHTGCAAANTPGQETATCAGDI